MAYRYKTVKVGGKTKLLHRHLMEQHLGRPLRRDEQVHHRNEDPHDNRIENLELMPSAAHQAHHKQVHPLTKTCGACGKEACSPACGYRLGWMKRRGEVST